MALDQFYDSTVNIGCLTGGPFAVQAGNHHLAVSGQLIERRERRQKRLICLNRPVDSSATGRTGRTDGGGGDLKEGR